MDETLQSSVGVVVNTHGLAGEVKVKVVTDFPDLRFVKGGVLYLQDGQQELRLVISHVRKQKEMLLISFVDYDHINKVLPWKGKALYIYNDQRHDLKQEEAYYSQIMHAQVYDMQDVYLGEVSEIIETGAHIVLRVTGKDRSMLLPFIQVFVKEFDKEAHVMHVDAIEGL